MKDKFSLFSPTQTKVEYLDSSSNFKKIPNKFAVYEEFSRPKESMRQPVFHTVSATNLDYLKKIPEEYSSLRQTLNYKTNNMEQWMPEEQKEKPHKPVNILRQTLNMKPVFKLKMEKTSSESFLNHVVQPGQSLYPKTDTHGGYGNHKKVNSYLSESKSWQNIYDMKEPERNPQQERYKPEEKKEKWRAEQKQKSKNYQKYQKYQREKTNDYYKPSEPSRYDNILEHLEQLKKISAGTLNSPRNIAERKKSPHIVPKDNQERGFKKKVKDQAQFQCYTPKPPKIAYEDRFKNIQSPASTEYSDNRSPPNEFTPPNEYSEVYVKKKNKKMGMDDFIVGKTLGSGKFGVVMMVQHKKTKSIFALKKIPKEMIRSHFMIDQLALQIRLQSCLNHKNILNVFGVFDDINHLYIVLEYMEQGTLYAQLKKNKILSETETATIIKQVAQAVQYLHDHDIAHRDIKPENIVISNNVFKLCDFGWATICDERRKTYCGTFDYAAPEILEGKDYDMSVDLWCLGVMTYELLTGKAPFYHISRKETVKKILNVQTQCITYPDTMSPQAVDFIENLVRKNPNDRMKAHDALKHSFIRRVEDQ